MPLFSTLAPNVKPTIVVSMTFFHTRYVLLLTPLDPEWLLMNMFCLGNIVPVLLGKLLFRPLPPNGTSLREVYLLGSNSPSLPVLSDTYLYVASYMLLWPRANWSFDLYTAIKPNEDPNDAMETHFNTSCAVMLGSDAAAKSKTPRCSRNKCEKVLYTPITCEVRTFLEHPTRASLTHYLVPERIILTYGSIAYSLVINSFAQRIGIPIPTNASLRHHPRRHRPVRQPLSRANKTLLND